MWLALAVPLSAQESAPKDPLTLTATLDKKEAVLGDEVQLEIKLQNTGEKDLEIAELIFEKQSLSFEITIPLGTGATKKTFAWWVVRPDPQVSSRLPLPRITLAKGQTLIAAYRLPTLRVGEMEIVAKYGGGGKEVKAAPAKVEVKPSSQGSRLAAILETEKGRIVIDLLPEEAPANVINFIQLARAQFFDGLLFHRVIRGNWVQTGCPYGLGIGGPGYAVPSEAKGTDGKPQDTKHDPGTVSMSGFEKTGFNGSQFFMCLGKLPALDGKYTVIGRISEEASLTVLQTLGRSDTDRNTDRPKEDLDLKKITIVVK